MNTRLKTPTRAPTTSAAAADIDDPASEASPVTRSHNPPRRPRRHLKSPRPPALLTPATALAAITAVSPLSGMAAEASASEPLLDVGVWRPSTGEWLIPGKTTTVLGGRGDVPVPG